MYKTKDFLSIPENLSLHVCDNGMSIWYLFNIGQSTNNLNGLLTNFLVGKNQRNVFVNRPITYQCNTGLRFMKKVNFFVLKYIICVKLFGIIFFF